MFQIRHHSSLYILYIATTNIMKSYFCTFVNHVTGIHNTDSTSATTVPQSDSDHHCYMENMEDYE